MDGNRKRQQTTQMDEILTEDAIMISTAHEDVDLGSALPTNLYFTICDDLSNDSADFLAINTSNVATQIKQEPKIEMNQTPLQYRLVRGAMGNANPTPISPTSLTLRAVSVDNSNSRAMPVGASNLLSSGTTAVQLPSGCEIYLVKEYVDSDCSDMLISEECEELPTTTTTTTNRLGHGITINHNTTQTASKIASVSLIPKAIKTEPGTQNQILNVISPKIEKTPGVRAAGGPAVSNYKKRDEKRRRTHNEVERRRRDKINSWIFKLKEMLPTESGGAALIKSKLNVKTMCNGISNSLPAATTTSTLTSSAQFDIAEQEQQQQAAQLQRNNSSNSRSPPSDSKSQILIKACEYIKQMQDEIKSLRECLMENEKLRSSNQRLQNELNRLKLSERRRMLHEQQQQQQQQQQQCNIDNTNLIDADDFTLTLCANGNSHLDDVATSTLFASTPTSPTSITLIGGSRKAAISVPYTKRELIISDYVD